jgi:hypothetical protein
MPRGGVEVESECRWLQARVMLRDIALRDHQVVALDAPDVDLVLVEGIASLRAALLVDDHREHSVPRGTANAGRYAQK